MNQQAKKPGGIKVVVADDSPRVREHLVSMITELEHVEVVGEAEDGQGAIEQVERLHPEAVVLDYQMPNVNGLAALQRIRRLFPHTLVIMLTNHADAYYRKLCLRHGANFFFDKTFEFEKVRGVLGALARA